MINFPQTEVTLKIEEAVLEKLQSYIPKNEEVGTKKVVEFITGARNDKDLKPEFKDVKVVTNPADENWIGFSYYYSFGGVPTVGLFQMDKRWWEKKEEVLTFEDDPEPPADDPKTDDNQ